MSNRRKVIKALKNNFDIRRPLFRRNTFIFKSSKIRFEAIILLSKMNMLDKVGICAFNKE